MNFLADESCAGPVIWALREAGHDVFAIAEVAKGATDEEVLDRALNRCFRACLRKWFRWQRVPTQPTDSAV